MTTSLGVKFYKLVVTDSMLKMTRNNTLLLVITGSVTSEFENLSGKVLEYGGEINWVLSVVALFEKTVDTVKPSWVLSVVALFEKTVDTVKPSFCGSRYGFASRLVTSGSLASLKFAPNGTPLLYGLQVEDDEER